jgi:hypothetical protein
MQSRTALHAALESLQERCILCARKAVHRELQVLPKGAKVFVLTNVHEGLLDLLVGGDGGGGVVLALEPGADGLQGAVCAAPATVVKLVLDHRKAA